MQYLRPAQFLAGKGPPRIHKIKPSNQMQRFFLDHTGPLRPEGALNFGWDALGIEGEEKKKDRFNFFA